MTAPVARDHGVDFGELAHVSQEVEERNALEPVEVVQHLDAPAAVGAAVRERSWLAEPARGVALEVHLAVPEEPVDLVRYTLDVPRELVRLQRRPFCRSSRRITYATRCASNLPSVEHSRRWATNQSEHIVPCQAEVQQPHQRDEVADVQARRGRIDSAVYARPGVDMLAQLGAGVSGRAGSGYRSSSLCEVGDEASGLERADHVGA